MKEARAARRYAGALLDLCRETGKVDAVASDLQVIHSAITSSHELSLFFKSPVVNRYRKRDAVREMFDHRVDKLTMNFLLLLIDKGREALVDQVAVEFSDLLDELRGIVNADLKAPYKPDEAMLARMKQSFETLVKKNVRIMYEDDRALLGGFLVQIGDTVYDGSVRRQLEILKRQLSEDGSI